MAKPLVTANQVTFVRLLLLPLPVAMVYQGTTSWYLGALTVYTLLGLTDAIDGILARRYGSTPIGALLDPIVDKIFLAAAYGPLADSQIIGMTFVATVFARELGVTALRSIALEERFNFRTTRLAKLKTTVQMAGAGFLLLIWLFPEVEIIRPLLIFAAAAAALPAVVSVSRGRKPGWRAIWGGVMIGALWPVYELFGRRFTIASIVGLIVAITLVSGLQYAWAMRRVLAARFARSPVEALRLTLLSLAVPALMLPALELPAAPTFLVLGVLAAEIAVSGLESSLVQAGVRRGPWTDLSRSGLQALAGVLLLAFSGRPGAAFPLSLVAWLVLFATLADLGMRFFANVDVFRDSANPPGKPGGPAS